MADVINESIPTVVIEKEIITVDNVTVNVDENILVGTFLGNETRNYYGDSSASSLNLLWRSYLGSGTTRINSKDGLKVWKGAGWTGQSLILKEGGVPFLFQGCYDHTLKKINSLTGEIIWSYEYEDVVKGTGTICKNDSSEYAILQGSRLGVNNNLRSKKVYSYRSVSASTGTENWRMNIKKGPSYSRDVDGSALILDDTAYLGLENGYFVVFDPNSSEEIIGDSQDYNEPKIEEEHKLFDSNDNKAHYGNLVTESSPCKLGDRVYIASGSGHVYGYNLVTDSIDWDLEIGSDIDGSPVVTNDSCLLISIEKQYIHGHGGVLKINPIKSPEESVVWFQPTGDRSYADWKGGVIGSPSTNAYYNTEGEYLNLACFIGIDGFLYVVEHDVYEGSLVIGPNKVNEYKTPRIVEKIKVGPSISTPIIVGNTIVAASYKGIYLFELDKNKDILQKEYFKGTFESTPVVNEGKIYIASRNGYLYCFGASILSNNNLIAVNSNDSVSSLNFELNEINEEVKIRDRSIKKESSTAQNSKEKDLTRVESQTDIYKNDGIDAYYIIIGTYAIKENAINVSADNFKVFGEKSGILNLNKLYYVYSYKSESKVEINSELSEVRNKCDCGAWVLKN